MRALIFDFNRTLYDPDRDQLLPGALTLLEECRRRKYLLVLLSKSRESGERQRQIANLDLTTRFDLIVVAEEKTPELILSILADLAIAPSQCTVIGDRTRRELQAAKRVGSRAIWLRQGKFANEDAERPEDKPDIIVTALDEVRNFI